MVSDATHNRDFEPGSVGLVETKYHEFAHPPEELVLTSGEKLGPISLAYETYGELNSSRDNAIMIMHALSGDAHVAGYNSIDEKKPGWWDFAVGPGKMYDTDKYFVICSNVIGGCKGSTGPLSRNPTTGKPYALDLPVITVEDMVRAQHKLLEHLKVRELLAVVGGSMGGMQALAWAVMYPEMVKTCLLIATSARLSAQGIALNEVSRQAIMADPDWQDGNYLEHNTRPDRGLSLARMIAHITYLSDGSLHRKFGRNLQDQERFGYNFNVEFQVESYLHYKGDVFIKRFDANSYLYITKAIDYFDLTEGGKISLAQALRPVKAKFLVLSFSSDWLYPPSQSQEVVRALKINNQAVAYCEIKSDYGHDSFLLPNPTMQQMVANFLTANFSAVKDKG